MLMIKHHLELLNITHAAMKSMKSFTTTDNSTQNSLISWQEPTTISLTIANSSGNSTSKDSAESAEICAYYGTHNLDVKIYLILLFGSTMAVISLTENIFVSYLFVSNSRFRNSQLFYLSVLAFLDVFLAISYLLLMSFMVLMDKTQNIHLYRSWIQYVRPMLSISLVALTTSVYLILAMSLERYFQTFAHHLVWLRNWIERHRVIVVIFVFLFATVIRGTKYWELSIVYKGQCAGSFGEYEFQRSTLFNNLEFHAIWTFWVRSIVHVLIPFPLLLFFNVSIFFTMRRHYVSEKRKSVLHKLPGTSTNLRGKGGVKEATKMLISVVSMYLISNVLNFITVIWEFIDRDSLFYNYFEFYDYSSDVISILTVISGALRLPVYCICNKYIRSETKRLLNSLKATILCRKKGIMKPEDVTLLTTFESTENGHVASGRLLGEMMDPIEEEENLSTTQDSDNNLLFDRSFDSVVEINLSDDRAETSIFEYYLDCQANGSTNV